MIRVRPTKGAPRYYRAEPGDLIRFYPDSNRPDAFVEVVAGRDAGGRVELRSVEGRIVLRPRSASSIAIEIASCS